MSRAATQWPTYRGNTHLSARSEAKGEIKEPKIRWKKFIGLWEGWVSICADGGTHKLALPGEKTVEDLSPAETKKQWEVGNPWYDLAGDGKKIQIQPNQEHKIAKLFPDVRGLQRVETPPLSRADSVARAAGTVRVLSYENGADKPREVWCSKFPGYNERPHVLAADMNGDGQLDVIVSGWQGILVYDGKNGNLLMHLPQEKWHLYRKRGYIAARDLDNDGYAEIVVIGQFTSHVDVIQNDGKDLEVAWFNMYEDNIQLQRRIVRSITHSLGDYDGDGRYEIVFNLWNEKGDEKWHIKGLDALTGKERFDLPGLYLHDALDIDGDGLWEMFCSEVWGLAVPEQSPLKIVKSANGQISEAWKHPKAAWAKSYRHTNPHFLTTHGVSKSLGVLGDDRIVFADPDGVGSPAVFIKAPGKDGTEICAYYIDNKGSAKKANLSLQVPSSLRADVVRWRRGKDTKDELLLQVGAGRPSNESIAIQGGKANLLSWQPISPDRINFPIIADLKGQGQNEIITRNGIDEIVCLEPQKAGPPLERWFAEGRGMAMQYTADVDYGVAAADINADGKKEVLLRRPGNTGASLVALSCDGETLWSREFQNIQSGELSGWQGHMAFWTEARLTGNKSIDVSVTVQRNIQHTALTYGLNGRDGTILWEVGQLSDGIWQSGAGGYPLTAVDTDGDGIDEILCGYGYIIFHADGKTGNVRFARFFRGLWHPYFIKKEPNLWIGSILPVPVKTKEGKTAFFCAAGGCATGLLDLSGQLVWGNDEILFGRCQCLANIDGNGTLWVAEFYEKDGAKFFHCYDPLDGKPHPGGGLPLRKKETEDSLVHLLGLALIPVAVDINGDGRDEVLLNRWNELVCIQWKNGKPQEAWHLDFPQEISPPVVGDVDGDSKVEILISTRDGYLYCVDVD